MADVKVKIGVDGSGLRTGLQSAKSDVDGFAKGAGAALDGFAAKMAGVFSVGAVVGWVKSIGDSVSAIQDTADRLDITAESVQGLSDYFAEGGARAQDFDKAMVRLNQALDDARGGNEKTIASFEALGVTWENIATSSPDQIILLIAEGMKNAENPTEALAAAMDVLGKSGARLVPGLKAGADEIERFVEASTKFSNEEVKQIDQAFDDMARGAKKASVEVAQLIMQMMTLRGLKNFGDAALDLIGIERKISTGAVNTPEANAAKAGNDARRNAIGDAKAVAEDPRAIKAREDQAKEAQRLQKEITATQDKEAKARLEEERACLLEQMELEKKAAEDRIKTQEKLTAEKARLAEEEAEKARQIAEDKRDQEVNDASDAINKRESKIDEELKSRDQKRAERRERMQRERTGRKIQDTEDEADRVKEKNKIDRPDVFKGKDPREGIFKGEDPRDRFDKNKRVAKDAEPGKPDEKSAATQSLKNIEKRMDSLVKKIAAT